MNENIKEYAKAIYMLAVENNSVTEYEKEMDLVKDMFFNNPQYVQLLSSPGIPLSERLDALDKAFSGSVSTHIMSLIKLMCENGYIRYFDDCVVEYKNMLNEINKCSNAKVTSAVELNEEEKLALKEKLEKLSGRKVVLECVIDKTIIGGLIVEIDGKTVNASVKRHLKNIKDVIAK